MFNVSVNDTPRNTPQGLPQVAPPVAPLSLSLILLGAAAFRLYGLGTLPYNYDEPFNIALITGPGWPLYSFQHPFLSIYLHRIGTVLIGSSPVGYRVMSVVCGTLSVGFAVLLGRAIRPERPHVAGLFAGILLATNRFHIGESRHVNQEMLYLTLLALALIGVWRVSQGGSWWLAGIALSLAVLTKEMAVLLLVPLAMGQLTRPDGRATLQRRDAWGALGLIAAAIGLVIALTWGFPARDQMNVQANVQRVSAIGLSTEPLEFFLMPLHRHDPLPITWAYPPMIWPVGALLLVGVLASWRVPLAPFAREIRIIVAWYIGFFTLVGAQGHAAEFWWVDAALFPCVVLTAGVLAVLWDRGRAWRLALTALVIALIAEACVFVSVTPGGPILAWLGWTYPQIVERFPVLF